MIDIMDSEVWARLLNGEKSIPKKWSRRCEEESVERGARLKTATAFGPARRRVIASGAVSPGGLTMFAGTSISKSSEKRKQGERP